MMISGNKIGITVYQPKRKPATPAKKAPAVMPVSKPSNLPGVTVWTR